MEDNFERQQLWHNVLNKKRMKAACLEYIRYINEANTTNAHILGLVLYISTPPSMKFGHYAVGPKVLKKVAKFG